ncbi:MAG: hypothetical protein KAJ11_09135 [Alphaproteobacteria bacterium]|nr:hypothetical protein [Alphaproteobacteria bacterium]
MRHIEFIGLPAAGKSTLIEALQHGDLARDRVIVAPLKRAPVTRAEKLSMRLQDLASISRQLLGSPIRSRRIWNACAEFGQPSNALRLRMYLNCLRADILARSAHGTANENNLVILEQGAYQAVWSLALRSEFHTRERFMLCCRRLTDCLATPGLVILVNTPPDVARQRLASEPDLHGRLPRLLESDPGWMRRAQENIESLWEIACEDPQVKTFRYTAGEDALNDLELILRQLSTPD